jgi:hypothetical protein
MQDLVTGEQFRKNVRENDIERLNIRKKLLRDRLQSQPLEHPGLILQLVEKISEHALELGMLDWRSGSDPRPYFSEMQNNFAIALAARPDELSGKLRPGFLGIVSSLMGWDLPVLTDPPADGPGRDDIRYMERWIMAGLIDSSCWPMKAKAQAAKNKFINQCLDDYWALLTDQVDPAEGVQRCIVNYNRRATHPTFKVLPTYLGGDEYNDLFVDYILAAILKNRGLSSNSVHDWVWS